MNTAVVALAAKMARIIWAVLRSGRPAGWMIRVRPKGSALQASVVCEWTEKMA